MGEPVLVDVVALDPVLEAGATSALALCPDVALATPGESPAVTVVIVDAVGPDVLDLVRATRETACRPEVVLVATDLALAEALHAIAAGARGLLRRREATSERLSRTVLAAAAGDCVVPPDMLDRMVDQTDGSREGAFAEWTGPGLSERERAILRLIAEGHETDEIAKQLCYSTRTVTSVVHDITSRFRLRNRAHAVAYAVRAGLL